ncbi:hypothetical protein SALWKB12_0352 [Snodgrassella communis]|uniref:Uncharacterized protein n=1 Tax=Snodgrassella communis TaxID=2946699 RepID=A0A836MT14_9NEIS|nr:hypothetical protein SALWKB12_0352 [Snodgrassella communis]KDN15793.1 hypothetical protein SALWKB29_0212 [Snodgrassella communis]
MPLLNQQERNCLKSWFLLIQSQGLQLITTVQYKDKNSV